ncbi:MAG: hypothetical protein HXY47_03535 [Nitrospirae bacterium]|nr:hypothetical protein [Nitrospirota bacterium]
MVKKLIIDYDEIQKAMEDITRDSFDYFLDLRTGGVIALSEDILSEVRERITDGDFEDLGDDIEYIEFAEEPDLPYWMEDEIELALEVLLNERSRYVQIPERDSEEAYNIMNEFIKTIGDPVLKEELTVALSGKGAFRKFKNVLLEYPKERKKWHAFNAKAMKNTITEWLVSLGIKPEQICLKKKKGEGRYVRKVELRRVYQEGDN